MANLAQKHIDMLKPIKEDVENAYNYFSDNYKRFHESKNFIFVSTLSTQEINNLNSLQRPVLEFNILESYISRLRGEFSKQEPAVTVNAKEGAQVNPQIVSLVEAHMKHELTAANEYNRNYELYTDCLAGGFSVGKVYADYAREMGFEQIIKFERATDPTLCGFDSLAKEKHKGDGRYCFEIIPKTKKEFEEEYPDIDISQISFNREQDGFNWSYRNLKEDIILVIDFYLKKRKRVKIIKLTDGRVIKASDYEDIKNNWDRIEQVPQPVDGAERFTMITEIWRYKVIENQVLEAVKTNYKSFPLIFFDGNGIKTKSSESSDVTEVTRSYVYQAKDLQRLKNLGGQTLANELENMRPNTLMLPEKGIPPAYVEQYINPQKAGVLPYRDFDPDKPEKPIAPPTIVPHRPVPPEVTNTFIGADKMMQSILGSYDASLGINDNQLSGVAIVEGATQSNSAAMPYVVGYLQGLNQAAQVIMELIPQVYINRTQLPIIDEKGKRQQQDINPQMLNYSPDDLQIEVKAGVNFSIQKSKALQQIIGLMQASPIFAQFMNTQGLPILLDNLEIRGIDQLNAGAEQFMMQMQQQQQAAAQQQQPDPNIMKAQNDSARIQMEQQQNQMQNMIKVQELNLQKTELALEQMRIMLEAKSKNDEQVASALKSRAENVRSTVDLAMKGAQMEHQHRKEDMETLGKVAGQMKPSIDVSVGG